MAQAAHVKQTSGIASGSAEGSASFEGLNTEIVVDRIVKGFANQEDKKRTIINAEGDNTHIIIIIIIISITSIISCIITTTTTTVTSNTHTSYVILHISY